MDGRREKEHPPDSSTHPLIHSSTHPLIHSSTHPSPMRIHIASRFNGPPESGNGGYSCGLIARTIGQPVRVRLQQPVPLNQDLVIEPGAAGQWEVHAGSELIATAAIHEVKAEVPQAPSWVEAFGASQHYAGFAAHNFPSCFTCGPARVQGDGLRIFAGAVPGTNLLAAPWRPDASLADADGRLPPEFVWSSLDCPGFWATCSASVALLGELAVDVAH